MPSRVRGWLRQVRVLFIQDSLIYRREALQIADDLERLRGDKGLFAYEVGVIRAALGDHDHAFTWFTRAVHERSGWIAYLRVDPRLEALHTDPRFDRLVVDTTVKSKS